MTSMGNDSISLAHTGSIPHTAAARGNPPIPSNRLPSLSFCTVHPQPGAEETIRTVLMTDCAVWTAPITLARVLVSTPNAPAIRGTSVLASIMPQPSSIFVFHTIRPAVSIVVCKKAVRHSPATCFPQFQNPSRYPRGTLKKVQAAHGDLDEQDAAAPEVRKEHLEHGIAEQDQQEQAHESAVSVQRAHCRTRQASDAAVFPRP